MRTKLRRGKMHALVRREDGKKRWIALDEITENERMQHRYRHGKPQQHNTQEGVIK